GKPHALECTGKVLGQPVGALRVSRLRGAQLTHQIAGIDAHRAALGAQAGRGAAVDALILVSGFQLTGIDTRALFCLNIAPDDDALARRQGQTVARTDRLTEAALDALV